MCLFIWLDKLEILLYLYGAKDSLVSDSGSFDLAWFGHLNGFRVPSERVWIFSELYWMFLSLESFISSSGVDKRLIRVFSPVRYQNSRPAINPACCYSLASESRWIFSGNLKVVDDVISISLSLFFFLIQKLFFLLIFYFLIL